MSDDIDRKSIIRAIARKNDKLYTEANAVCFYAKDLALPAAIRAYREECLKLGSDDGQLRAVDLLYDRVLRYQAEHPEEVKVPDVDPGEEFERIVMGLPE